MAREPVQPTKPPTEEPGKPYPVESPPEPHPNEDRPLIVETLSEVLDGLADAAGRFRRAEARALYQEGWTHEQISRFFGVTRQRIGALLGRERKRTTPA